jgi:glycine cleavage system H lipoate-binding protein
MSGFGRAPLGFFRLGLPILPRARLETLSIFNFAGQVCGEVESTKSVSEIYSPVTGKVLAVNASLDGTPELINQDPYITGWIAEIEISETPSELLSSAEYEVLTA